MLSTGLPLLRMASSSGASVSLYKRPDSPVWQFDVTTADGHRRRGTTKEQDAKKALKAAKRILAGEPSRRPRATLQTALDAYAEHLQLEGKASAREAASLANKLLGRGSYAAAGRFKFEPSRPLIALSGADLMDLRTARMREGNGKQTIAHELKTLRAALYHARRCGHAIPTLEWKVPTAKFKTRWLSMEEWQAVYAQLDPQRPVAVRQSLKPGRPVRQPLPPSLMLAAKRHQAQDLLVALTLCGGRWGELTRLTLDQIQPGGTIRLYGYKTERERIVPCPPLMAEALKQRRAAAEAVGSVYLFPANGKDGAQRWSGAIKRAFDRAGINAPHLVERHGRATIHSLRHTFASWLLQNGMNLAEVQDLLGHETLQMTRRYAHLAAGASVTKAAETLDRLFADNEDHGADLTT